MRTILALAITLVLGSGTAVAQAGKSLRERLVGTWSFVIA